MKCEKCGSTDIISLSHDGHPRISMYQCMACGEAEMTKAGEEYIERVCTRKEAAA